LGFPIGLLKEQKALLVCCNAKADGSRAAIVAAKSWK
jgi:hypothetical protein